MTRPTVTRLANGLRIVCEPMPQRSSVAIGLWLARGSRHEPERQGGITHFCEHLLFKGTPQHTWQELARSINLFGGHFNACTSTDWIKIYGTVISADVPEAFDLLAEMFLHSTFPDGEVAREREVILEEIAQYEDVPEDLCYEHFTRALYLPHPLGRPVIGSERSVAGFSRGELADYWQAHLSPEDIVISVAGGAAQEAVVALAEKHFGSLTAKAPRRLGMEAAPGKHEVVLLERDLEQVSFCFGTTGPSRHSPIPERFSWAVFDTILGAGMGSRLFDEVREKRGLAYSIGSTLNAVHGAGYLMIGGSSRPEAAGEAVEVCMEELGKLAAAGPTDSEMVVARKQIARSHLLALESVGMVASANGERELYGLEYVPTPQVLENLEAVSIDDVREIARRVVEFGTPSACFVGPLADAKGLEESLTASTSRRA